MKDVAWNLDIEEKTIFIHGGIVKNDLHHVLGGETSLVSQCLDSPLGVGLRALETNRAIVDIAIGVDDDGWWLKAKLVDGSLGIANVVEDVVISSVL